jgi:hypothetical protein
MLVLSPPILHCVNLMLLTSMEHHHLHRHCYSNHYYRGPDAAVSVLPVK